MINILKTDFEYKDSRGELIQLIHKGYEQVNLLISLKGVTRGEHYHKKAREAFYVIKGRVNVTCTFNGKSEEYNFSVGDFFEISQMVLHSMYFPEDCTMVQLYSVPVENENGEKDIYTS